MHLILMGCILLFCAFVQSAVGFAFSLFSNALLLLLGGFALPEVVMLSILGSTLQRLLMLSRMHPHVDWRQTLPMSGICLLALPVGIYMLKLFSRQSSGVVKFWLGIVILLILLVQKVWKVKPHQTLHRSWGVLAAAASGLLTGLANIGGPPLLLWVHAHDWSNGKMRVTLSAITTLMVPFQLVIMVATFSWGALPSVPQALMLVPAVGLGTALGMIAGERLSKQWLRHVAFGLLIVISIVCMAGR
jgi:uncharacterized membrane protein YfcA